MGFFDDMGLKGILYRKLKPSEKSLSQLQKERGLLIRQIQDKTDKLRKQKQKRQMESQISELRAKLGENRRGKIRAGYFRVQNVAQKINRYEPKWQMLMENPLAKKKK